MNRDFVIRMNKPNIHIRIHIIHIIHIHRGNSYSEPDTPISMSDREPSSSHNSSLLNMFVPG